MKKKQKNSYDSSVQGALYFCMFTGFALAVATVAFVVGATYNAIDELQVQVKLANTRILQDEDAQNIRYSQQRNWLASQERALESHQNQIDTHRRLLTRLGYQVNGLEQGKK